jgi:hypothetical protein
VGIIIAKRVVKQKEMRHKEFMNEGAS